MVAPFNLEALLAIPAQSRFMDLKAEWQDTVASIVVFNIPEQIELIDLHLNLTRHFKQCAPEVRVNLQEADLLKKTSLQECRIRFSPAIHREIGELGILQVLEKQCRGQGMRFDDCNIQIECQQAFPHN